MNAASPRHIACSAPGKVLLAGGYLVLDRAHTGLVLGLDARIHVLAQSPAPKSDPGASEIVVRSPQFKDAIWRYEITKLDYNGGIQLTQLKGSNGLRQSENRFVQTALTYALTWVFSHKSATIQSAEFTILADSDYNSNEGTPFAHDDRFLNYGVPLQDAHKTGLGSSAALVTAMVNAAVLLYVNQGAEHLHPWLFHLAQTAHCAAQGKIGSGFDVAAASKGSCMYRRFSPEILETVGDAGQPGFGSKLQPVVEERSAENSELKSRWDYDIGDALFPIGLRIVMCDIDCGSETVGMVSKVLQWRKENAEEAALLWTTLQTANEDLASQLSDLTPKEITTTSDYGGLRSTILTIRSLVREMSAKAGVPIEPPAQTALLDACSELPGVVGGVVPGAGGYDAVALIVIDQREVIDRLRSFLAGYKSETTGNETVGIERVRMLQSKQVVSGGWRIEDHDRYLSWLQSRSI